MPSYQQNKINIYNWRKNQKDKHLIQSNKDAKNYYQKNKEKIIMYKMAKYYLGNQFYSLCLIYTNLYE